MPVMLTALPRPGMCGNCGDSLVAKTEYEAQSLPRGAHSLTGHVKYLENERVGNKASVEGVNHQRTGEHITGTGLLANMLCLSECFYIHHLICSP